MRKHPDGWIQTFTGNQFWPIEPAEEDLNILDIAHALGHMCRYAGHCERFYSVAEHSVLISHYLPAEFKLAGLLHDASEAYLVDIPRPIKPFLENYMEIEDRLMVLVAKKYGFQWPMADEVKKADYAILHDEYKQNMARGKVAWNLEGEPLGVTLRYWSPEEASRQFLKTFLQLVNREAA